MSETVLQSFDRALAELHQGGTVRAKRCIEHLPSECKLQLHRLLDVHAGFLRGDIINATERAESLAQQIDNDDDVLSALAITLQQFELWFTLNKLYDCFANSQRFSFFERGRVALHCGQIDKAINLLEQETDPATLASAHLHLGHGYKALAKTQDAVAHYRRFYALQTESAGVFYWSLADLNNYHFSQDELEKMEMALPKVKALESGLLMMAISRGYEQHKDYNRAGKWLISANQTINHQRQFNPEHYSAFIASMMEKLPPIDAPKKHRPLMFVTGIPRSGTTLTEQILVAHSEVESSDELPFAERIAMYLSQQFGYPWRGHAIDAKRAQQCQRFYLQQAGLYARRGDTRLIDKNPNNFIHLGLIAGLFPEAVLYAVTRPVRDNVISLFRQYFSRGNEYAFDINNILIYLEGYYNLMLHWKDQLKDRLVLIDYEQLVKNPDEEIKGLLSNGGLCFESACLAFHNNQRPVLTPSASQVRKPINASRLGYWQHYQSLLKPYEGRLILLEKKRATLYGN